MSALPSSLLLLSARNALTHRNHLADRASVTHELS